MYLFRGDFGCMLYTGDFRWETTSRRAQIARDVLLKALKNEKLDTLYLDNTYCNPSYCFPSREVAAKQVVNIITAHPNHDIVIGVDSLGKEDLLHYISQVLKIKIWVWPERLQTMHLLGFQENFTTRTLLTRVRAIPRYSFSIETLEGLNMMRPTIGIMPSGLPWANKIFKGSGNITCPPSCTFTATKTERTNGNLVDGGFYNQYIYAVPYSDHSCFAEIKEFVELLQPTSIKGIVSSSPSYVEPLYYFGNFGGTDQDSRMWYQKHWNKERVKRLEAFQIRSPLGSTNSYLSRRRKRKSQVGFLVSQVNRVSILRRARSGIKITDTEFP